MEEAASDFHCCCSINRDDFETSGTSGIHIFNSIVLIPLSLSTTLGNFLVLVSIWRTPSLHSPSNVLLFGLAVSDLGVGLIAEPIGFVYNIVKLKRIEGVFCNIAVAQKFIGSLLCFASLLTVTAMSLNMNVALYLHLRYQEIVTVKRMTGVLVGIWLFSITLSLSYIFSWIIVGILWMIVLLLCLLVTTAAYYRVLRIVCHHQAQIDAQTQVQQQAEESAERLVSIAHHRKCLLSNFFVYLFFVLCYLPFIVMTIVLRTTEFSVTKQAIHEMFYVFIYFNSILNPFVYCWRFQMIRAALIETAKKIVRPAR